MVEQLFLFLGDPFWVNLLGFGIYIPVVCSLCYSLWCCCCEQGCGVGLGFVRAVCFCDVCGCVEKLVSFFVVTFSSCEVCHEDICFGRKVWVCGLCHRVQNLNCLVGVSESCECFPSQKCPKCIEVFVSCLFSVLFFSGFLCDWVKTVCGVEFLGVGDEVFPALGFSVQVCVRGKNPRVVLVRSILQYFVARVVAFM